MIFIAHVQVLAADSQPIRLDGRFADWEDKRPVSAPGDATLVRSVRVTNGVDNVFIEIQLNREIVMQNANPLTLFIDTDRDPATGLRVGTIGADVQYKFGVLEAIRHVDGISTSVPHTEIGISWAPTFSADRYEIALPLALFGQSGPNEAVTLAVAELGDIEATATFVIHRLTSPDAVFPPISPEKLPPPYVRLLTMNVLYDGLFEKPEIYERIFQALDPDILLLSEIFSHSADEVVALLNERFPAKNQQRVWYGFGTPGKVTISRYPFLETDVIFDDLYTLIDAPGFDEGLFVVHTHLECCDNDEKRQEKVDAILSEVQSSREDTDSILYQYQDRPLVFSGDLNLVGESRQYHSLVDGINADLSAVSSKKFVEAISYHTNSPHTFTWKDDTLKWTPGKLDFSFLTVPDVVLGKSFVLYTPEMDPGTLRHYGLRKSDSIDASDHLPHVIDIAPGVNRLRE